MKKLSILIPVFNEKTNILKVIDSVISADTLDFEKEIIIIDDYSTDGTRDILKERNELGGFALILAEKNGGKGAALKLGLKEATGDFILFQDADLEYSTDNYKDILAHANENVVVFGSRYLQKNKRNHLSIGARAVNLMFNVLFGTKITDVATCYKIFPAHVKESLITLPGNDFVYDVVEASVVAVKKVGTIKEVPISYTPRTYEEGKKLRIKHGLRIVFSTLQGGIKYRFFE
ncbi:MAG: hypothetical protein RI935_738 [Candidatus Parcubacteria bacterium]|jgi:glycosyltransferase involved in cell wall biosynthesis